MDIKKIAAFYGLKELNIIKKIDSSRGDKDYRKTILVVDKEGCQFAIKIANNCFTGPERIRGWQKIIEKYNYAGIYAPRILSGLNGEVYYRDLDLIAYVEEGKKYPAADEFTPPVNYKNYEEAIFLMIGKIAAGPGDLYPWPTAYSLYDVFSAEDKTDENRQCASEWYQLFSRAVPNRSKVVEEIWRIYRQLRGEFEAEYRSLPKASFQGDLNSSNILLDEKREFVGLIDFNLSGTETILNYCLCESVCKEVKLDRLMQPSYLETQDRILKKRLDFIAINYKFTDSERTAYPKLYHLVVPFRWPAFFSFRQAVRENRAEHFNDIVDWVYLQITRKDLKL